MSKPLKMTEQMIKECVEQFEKDLRSMRLFNGKIKYEDSYEYKEDEKATIIYSQLAYAKQLRLINDFSTEVAWNGIVRRDKENPYRFYVEDIIVFPQKVTGATVTPDQKEYDMWLMSLPQDQFDNCRFHGHSHVNMGTSPSGTDDNCQKQILGRLDGDGLTPEEKARVIEEMGDRNFYIFMIWNKRGEYTVRIYDMYTNTYFEGKEIDVVIEGQEDLNDFISDAKKKVTTSYYVSSGSGSYHYPSKKTENVSGQTSIGFKADDKKKDSIRNFPYEYGDEFSDGYPYK